MGWIIWYFRQKRGVGGGHKLILRLKRKRNIHMRPCQGGLPGRLSEFQNVPCRHFLIVLSEVRVAVGNLFNCTAVCRYFI